MTGKAAVLFAISVVGLSAGPTAGWAAQAARSNAPAAAVQYKTSEEQFAAMRRAARKPVSPLPDWSGLWERDPKTAFAFDTVHRFGYPGGMDIPLNAAGRAIYDKTLANLRAGIEWDPLSQCLPAGFPRIITEPFQIEFVNTPGRTWIMYELGNETRRIYTDNRGHYPEDSAYPLWSGDSIGFWDGDTLVVHTKNVRANPQGYQRDGAPQSDQLSAVERYRRVDPKRIEVQITIYDPVYLTRPWSLKFYETKIDGPFRLEYWSCAESSKVTQTADGGTLLLLPGEPGYQDPNRLLDRPEAGAK